MKEWNNGIFGKKRSIRRMQQMMKIMLRMNVRRNNHTIIVKYLLITARRCLDILEIIIQICSRKIRGI